jgi:hypothetical protein
MVIIVDLDEFPEAESLKLGPTLTHMGKKMLSACVELHCRVLKDPTLGPILSQMNRIHYLFLMINFNIILPSEGGLQSGLFPLGFPSNSFTH